MIQVAISRTVAAEQRAVVTAAPPGLCSQSRHPSYPDSPIASAGPAGFVACGSTLVRMPAVVRRGSAFQRLVPCMQGVEDWAPCLEKVSEVMVM